MNRISCIIPTYNEGARIAGVLEAVVGHPLVDEVIVVDDGSSDTTCEAVTKFTDVKLIRSERNNGKSKAIVAGIRASHGDLLLFLDGDLIGLTPDAISALARPVLEGNADFSISLRGNALLPWRIIGLDYLSGERVLHRSLIINQLEAIEGLPGFGLESHMNALLLKNHSRIRVVWWPNVDSPYKARKYGLIRGIIGEVRMLMNIVETVTLFGTGYQIVAMWQARV